MNKRNFDSEKASSFAKIIANEYSYKPGPLMEEKIIREIKKSKLRKMFFRVALVVAIGLIVIFSKFEALELSILKERISAKLSNTGNSPTLSTEQVKESENNNDLLFKMLKYVAIASDGNW